jgi:hypothetical protein
VSVLSEIKRKSAGIRLLIKKTQDIIADYENKQEIISIMIGFLAGIDRALDCPSEKKNRSTLLKALTIGLEVMKSLGAEELHAEKGTRLTARSTVRLVWKKSLMKTARF